MLVTNKRVDGLGRVTQIDGLHSFCGALNITCDGHDHVHWSKKEADRTGREHLPAALSTR